MNLRNSNPPTSLSGTGQLNLDSSPPLNPFELENFALHEKITKLREKLRSQKQ